MCDQKLIRRDLSVEEIKWNKIHYIILGITHNNLLFDNGKNLELLSTTATATKKTKRKKTSSDGRKDGRHFEMNSFLFSTLVRDIEKTLTFQNLNTSTPYRFSILKVRSEIEKLKTISLRRINEFVWIGVTVKAMQIKSQVRNLGKHLRIVMGTDKISDT